MRRVIACRRCAVKYPDERPTPLAWQPGPDDPLWTHAPDRATLLYRVGRAPKTHSYVDGGVLHVRRSWQAAQWVAEPLTETPQQTVLLTCRHCRLRVGPISGRGVARHYAKRHGGEDEVLLLPWAEPASG